MTTLNKLESGALKGLKEPGRYSDGGGLYFVVRKPKKDGTPGGKSWSFIWKRNGKKTEIGFGSFKNVSLKLARQKAKLAREDLEVGDDPRDRYKPPVTTSFLYAATKMMQSLNIETKSKKTVQQWNRSLMVLL